MSFAIRKAEVASNTVTGVQTISPPGGDPGLGAAKAAVFFGVFRTADGAGAPGRFFMGVATPDGADGYASWTSDDAAGTAIGGGGADQTAALKPYGAATTPTVDAIATVSAWNADGSIGLNWSDAPSSAWRLHVVLFYGTDVTNATCGLRSETSGTGSKSVTGVGFSPSFVLRLGIAAQSSVRNNGAHFDWGMFTATQSAAGGMLTTEATTMANACGQRSGRSYWSPSSAGATLFDATLTSMDADGWTENYTTVVGAHQYVWLALRGPQVAVGVDTKPTSASSKATNVGFSPAGGLLFSWGQAASTAIDTSSAENCKLSVGAFDSAGNEGSVWVGDQDNIATSETNTRTSATKALQFTSDFTGTVDSECDSSVSGTGFSLNWTTADGTASEFAYAVFGAVAAVKQTAAVVAGASSVIAAVARRRAVAAAVAAVSTTTAAVTRKKGAQPLVAGVSTVAAAPVRKRTVQAVVGAVSTVTAAPTRKVGAQPLVAGASTVVAAPSRRRAVAALVGALSTAAAAAGARRNAQAAVSAVSTVEAIARRANKYVNPVVDAVSTVTVTPSRRRAVAALVTGSSAVTAAAGARRNVTALVGATSSVTAAPSRRRAVAAAIASLSTVQALPTRPRRVQAAVGASSSVTASAGARRAVAPSVFASSSVTVAQTTRLRQVAVAVDAVSDVQAAPTTPVTILPTVAIGYYV